MKQLLPMTVIYVLMFLTGVVGNVAVCFVIIHNKTMHTATNFYLFSLAVSDLSILLLGKDHDRLGSAGERKYSRTYQSIVRTRCSA